MLSRAVKSAGQNNRAVTQAAVGVLQAQDGSVLLAQRPLGKPWSGYWEFPGGKIEVGETPADALVRELQEELGITPTQFYPWITRTYEYGEKYDAQGALESLAKTVRLHFFVITAWKGDVTGLEQQALCWQQPRSVTVTPMLPANAPILSALDLPVIYGISNLREMGEQAFFSCLRRALKHGLTMLQIREKQLDQTKLLEFSKKVMAEVEPYSTKVFINGDQALAQRLGAAGVHFPSDQLMTMMARPEGLLCGASCHSPGELQRAASLGLDYVMLSPVQPTSSHPGVDHLGWDRFGQMVADYPLPVYALGGMGLKDLSLARMHGAHGIALQREIWSNQG